MRSKRLTGWQKSLASLREADARLLREGIRVLAKYRAAKHPLALEEQPFDSHLLRASLLFKKSRSLYVASGGRYRATLVSSPRTLTSPILLEQRIEYTPIERELVWTATDRREKTERLLRLRTYCTNLFHEQNHRILWKFLPPPPRQPREVSRYLNFVESLIVALDMALGDELGHEVSRFFYLCGVSYDPGTDIQKALSGPRDYRNYLHACAYATFMKLELFDDSDIRKAISRLYPQNGKLLERAISRALRLDDDFVQITNPGWQKKHIPEVIRQMGQKTGKGATLALTLPADPLENHLHYLWAERWFDRFDIR